MAVTVADEQRQEPVKPLEDVQEERSDGPLPEVGSVQDQQDVVGHVQQMGEVEHLKMVARLSSKFTVATQCAKMLLSGRTNLTGT